MSHDRERFAELAERHRREIHVHCYRMLGSFEEAEDLAQETFLRAWRRRADLERDEYLRAWLYKIATNACLDAAKAKGRRVPSLSSFRDLPWLEPYPDGLLDQAAPAAEEPDAALIGSETIELTFLAVVQLLPPATARGAHPARGARLAGGRGRRAARIGVAAVNRPSSARGPPCASTFRPTGARAGPRRPASEEERAVLDGFIAAHESGDTDATLALLREDIRVTMPPAPYLFEGRDAIAGLVERARGTGSWRLIPTAANRQPAAASYLRRPGRDRVHRLQDRRAPRRRRRHRGDHHVRGQALSRLRAAGSAGLTCAATTRTTR